MEVDVLGGKHNLTDVNAVIGIHQLKQLPELMKQRKALAQHYFTCFKKTSLIEQGLELPMEDFLHSNWHMFQVVLPIEKLNQLGMNRATVMQKLKDMNIGTGVHYPLISDFKLYQELGYNSDQTPVAQRVGSAILTLPLFPLMTTFDVERVVHALQLILQEI
jgi:dTDP-4-amino-4,6-dideoxygalactose transaminase